MIVLFSPQDISAQDRLFTLDDYLAAALKQSPVIASSRLQKSAADYGSRAVREGYLPRIGIDSQLLAAPTGGYDPTVTNGGQLGAQLGASYVLYNGGLKGLEIDRGDLGVVQGAADLRKVEADVLYGTSIAFATAVKEKRELSVLEENVALLRDYLTLVTELHAAGQADESDVLTTSVQLTHSIIEADAKKSAFQKALIDLSRETGVRFGGATDVDTSFAPASIDSTFDPTGNIDLAAAELERRAADFDAEMARAKSGPTISLEADAGALTSLPDLPRGLPDGLGAEIGLSFTLPIIAHGYYNNQYAAAHLRAEALAARNESLAESLAAEFSRSRTDYLQSKRALEALERNLTTAKDNLALTKARYAGGGGSSLEVLNAIQLIHQVKTSMEEARNTIAVSAFGLRRLNYRGDDAGEK